MPEPAATTSHVIEAASENGRIYWFEGGSILLLYEEILDICNAIFESVFSYLVAGTSV